MMQPDKLGDLIVAVVVSGGILLKYVSDRQTAKARKETTEDLEVITKEEFEKFSDYVERSLAATQTEKRHFNDMMALMAILNIVMTVMGQDKKLLRQAKDQTYMFLRHADFASREMVTSAIDVAFDERIEQTNENDNNNAAAKEITIWRGGDDSVEE